MKRTYLYKAKINKQTEANGLRWLELCRLLYNLALEQRIVLWNQHKYSISYYEQKAQLPQLKRECPEFKVVGSQVLQNVIERVDKAFQGFFRRLKTQNGKVGFPRFKSKNRYDSFTLTQAGWMLEGRNLYIKNVGRFGLFLSRAVEGTIKTITIRRTSSGKWFVSFSCDNVPEKEFPETTSQVGIDVGIEHFLVDSEGREVENPKYFRKSEKLLRRRQRSLSRKHRGSKRRKKARIVVAKAHEKIANQRRHFLHNEANYYIKRFKDIFVEDLNIKGMVKNHHLSKSIVDCSWGMFFNFLSYKAEEAGRRVGKVPPKNTSQICSRCGAKVRKSLAVRIHNCPYCNLKIGRDFNSALNELRLGQSLQALTPPMGSVA